MTTTGAGTARGAARPGSAGSNLRLIAAREAREALTNKWFILLSAAFALLATGLSFVSLAGTGGYGFSGFGRTAAGLVNLVALIVPLMALVAGAGSIAGERERGMLVYMLAQPVARWEVIVGKYVGLSLATLSSLCLGFGVSAGALAWRAGVAGAAGFAALVGWTCLLALAMLSVGVLLSASARRAGVASGVGVFVWLALVFLTDLGLMAGALAFRLRVEELFSLALLNPLQAYKMGVLHSVHASLDVLGPAGIYAVQEFGEGLSAVLLGAVAAWIVLPLLAAVVVFQRRSPL